MGLAGSSWLMHSKRKDLVAQNFTFEVYVMTYLMAAS